jgi:hypothetical protein
VPALGHLHADAARDQKGAAQIDIDLAVPLIHSHALDPVHLAEDAGGVDKSRDRAVRGLDIGDTADDGAFVGDIERGRPQDRLRSCEWLRRDVRYYDPLALSGQQHRGCGANAAAAAGDENDAFSGHGRCPCPV